MTHLLTFYSSYLINVYFQMVKVTGCYLPSSHYKLFYEYLDCLLLLSGQYLSLLCYFHLSLGGEYFAVRKVNMSKIMLKSWLCRLRYSRGAIRLTLKLEENIFFLIPRNIDLTFQMETK